MEKTRRVKFEFDERSLVSLERLREQGAFVMSDASDCSTSGRKISFSKRNNQLAFNAKRGGILLAIIDHSDGRFYWYKMDRTVGDWPLNTLSVNGSAVTLKGCKDEILKHFGK